MKRNRVEVAALGQMCRGLPCAQITCEHLRKSPAGLSALKQRWNSVFRELFSLIQILPLLRLGYAGPNVHCADFAQSKEGRG